MSLRLASRITGTSSGMAGEQIFQQPDALDAHGFEIGHVRLERGGPRRGFLDDLMEEIARPTAAPPSPGRGSSPTHSRDPVAGNALLETFGVTHGRSMTAARDFGSGKVRTGTGRIPCHRGGAQPRALSGRLPLIHGAPCMLARKHDAAECAAGFKEFPTHGESAGGRARRPSGSRCPGSGRDLPSNNRRDPGPGIRITPPGGGVSAPFRLHVHPPTPPGSGANPTRSRQPRRESGAGAHVAQRRGSPLPGRPRRGRPHRRPPVRALPRVRPGQRRLARTARSARLVAGHGRHFQRLRGRAPRR